MGSSLGEGDMGVIARAYEVSLSGNGSSTAGVLAQLCEHSRSHSAAHFRQRVAGYVDYILTKPLNKKSRRLCSSFLDSTCLDDRAHANRKRNAGLHAPFTVPLLEQ